MEERVTNLLHGMVATYDACRGLGSMSCSVYDTAWVACISKPVTGSPEWLFPSSFSYVLNSQLPDGGWPAHPGAKDTDEVDGILSTLAALFCLKQHARNPFQLVHLDGVELATKIAAGSARASQQLRDWKVENCNSVGFEVLVPTLLELLEDEGLFFEFDDKPQLLQVRTQKLAKIRPEMLYQGRHFALLHSLEAFHRWDNFEVDRCAHQKIGGSMMASPSATASYLMRCSKWDDEAEEYLRLVLSHGAGKNSGGVPSAYPSTNFELIWVAAVLLEAGVWHQDSNAASGKILLDVLEESRTRTGGLIGFAPGIEPDLDDSAKASIIFTLLGRQGFTASILQHFDSAECLKTYHAERNPSVSANCNALLSIVLDQEEYPSKSATVEKIINFVCRSWSNSGGSPGDKWNYSPFYPAMLVAQCLVEVLRVWEAGKLPQLPQKLLKETVMIVLFQCLIQTIQSQKVDGSWGAKGPREETSYAVLILARLSVLPMTRYFRPQILSAIYRGREFLSNSIPHAPEHLWIEKVSYGSANIAEAYIVAALQISLGTPFLGPDVEGLCKVDFMELSKFGLLINQGVLPWSPRWLILASWIECHLCDLQLQSSNDNSSQLSAVAAPYELMAFQWTLANNMSTSNFPLQFLCNMIICSRRNHQISILVEDAINSQNDERMQQLIGDFSDVTGHIECSWTVSEQSQNGIPTSSTIQKDGCNEIVNERLLPNGNSTGADIRKSSSESMSGAAIMAINVKLPKETLLNGKGQKLSLYQDVHAGQKSQASQESTTPFSAIGILSSYIEFFDNHPCISSASKYDREILKYEVKRFFLAQIAHIEERRRTFQQRERQNNQLQDVLLRIPCLGRQGSFFNMPAGFTGLPVTFAFATCLRACNMTEIYPAVSQKFIARNIWGRAEAIFLIEREINQLHCCSPRSRAEELRGELKNLLSYEKNLLDLDFEHLRKLALGNDTLDLMRLVIDVAEIGSKTCQIPM